MGLFSSSEPWKNFRGFSFHFIQKISVNLTVTRVIYWRPSPDFSTVRSLYLLIWRVVSGLRVHTAESQFIQHRSPWDRACSAADQVAGSARRLGRRQGQGNTQQHAPAAPGPHPPQKKATCIP